MSGLSEGEGHQQMLENQELELRNAVADAVYQAFQKAEGLSLEVRRELLYEIGDRALTEATSLDPRMEAFLRRLSDCEADIRAVIREKARG